MVCSKIKVRKIVREFVNRLKKDGLPIEKVYLFGSYAWGKPSAHSDIDVAVISHGFKKWNDIKRIKVLSNIARFVHPDLEIEIDAVGFTDEEMEKASYFDLATDIRQRGKLIYKKAA